MKKETFIEKPNLEIVSQFIESGDFLWNSGMFIWSVDNIINLLKIYYLKCMTCLRTERISGVNRESEFINNIFPCKNINIDYGIMEKSNNVFVYPSEFGWSDLGTWGSLSNHLDSDEKNNFYYQKIF